LIREILPHACRPGHRVSEAQARWLFQQLIIALDFCHKRGVANRDLKLENLLLDASNTALPCLKICDFGYSKHEMNSSAKTGVGTAIYMAPEVILGDDVYDAKKADLWSTGIILYAMLFGRYPFDIKDGRFMRKMIKGEYEFPSHIKVCWALATCDYFTPFQ
jgi:serine/threonine-protein kinase SRK2